jgi:hypothetical protein
MVKEIRPSEQYGGMARGCERSCAALIIVEQLSWYNLKRSCAITSDKNFYVDIFLVGMCSHLTFGGNVEKNVTFDVRLMVKEIRLSEQFGEITRGCERSSAALIIVQRQSGRAGMKFF